MPKIPSGSPWLTHHEEGDVSEEYEDGEPPQVLGRDQLELAGVAEAPEDEEAGGHAHRREEEELLAGLEAGQRDGSSRWEHDDRADREVDCVRVLQGADLGEEVDRAAHQDGVAGQLILFLRGEKGEKNEMTFFLIAAVTVRYAELLVDNNPLDVIG